MPVERRPGRVDGHDHGLRRVILATPNYSFQVSGLMKNFHDHFGFVFHRPRNFGRLFTSIVTQGIAAGTRLSSYLDFVAATWL